jgi:ribonuclease HI
MTTGWAKRWQANRWKLPDGQEVKSADLWQQLIAQDIKYHVRFCSMKGLSSHPDSVCCTELAAGAVKGRNLLADFGYEESVSSASRNR